MLRFLLVASAFWFQQCGALAPNAPSRHSVKEFAENVNDRRTFFSSVAAATTAVLTFSSPAVAATDKVLVLGGTGLVGSRVVQKLKSMGVDVVATSRDGRDGTVKLNFISEGVSVASEVESLAKGCSAVISTVGSIGTPQDATINGGTGLAAGGAKKAGVGRFVYISNAPEVRDFAKDVSFLEGYMEGKKFSEESVVSYFGPTGSVLIEPTFIHGGDKFGVNPPRVTSTYGKLIEGVLSSAPLRAATNVAPEGFIKVALEPPVAAEAVADAAVAGALGRISSSVLDTYDKINDAAKTI